MSSQFAKAFGDALRNKFPPFVQPRGPKEGTSTGLTAQTHVLCMSHVASRRRMSIRSEIFVVSLTTRESASARGGATFRLPQRAIDATTQGRQRQGTKSCAPSQGTTPAPLPLPSFPVVDSSSRAEHRLLRQPLDVSALILTSHCSRLLVPKKREGINSLIYLSCISIKLSLTSDRASDFDSFWNPGYKLKFSRIQFRVSVLLFF